MITRWFSEAPENPVNQVDLVIKSRFVRLTISPAHEVVAVAGLYRCPSPRFVTAFP